MKKINVSIVDDDKVYHYTSKKTILGLGFDINLLSFFNGEEAINHMKLNLDNPHHLPDTIFLDINMPVMDGWDFMNDYIELEYRLPKPIVIYIVSSSVSETDIDKAKSYKSVSGYLIKPIAKNQFYTVLNAMVA